MFLALNPHFPSQLRDSLSSTLQKVFIPSDISVLHRFVVSTFYHISTPVCRIETSLALRVPGVSIPRPPLPPPPPPDARFTIGDRFSTPTYIPPSDEVGSLLGSSVLVLWAIFLGVTVCSLLGSWTIRGLPKCKAALRIEARTSSLSRRLVEDVRRSIAIAQTALNLMLFGLLAAGRKISTGLTPAAARCALWVVNTSGRVVKIISGRLLSTATHILVRVVPWVAGAAVSAAVWLFSVTYQTLFQPNPPIPLRPEKAFDDPVPVPPQLAPPAWTRWIEIVLAGGPRTELRPEDIVTQRFLGKGGFGSVSQGYNRATGSAIAIKRAWSFRRSVPRLLGSFLDDKDYILVMDFLPGGTMLDKIDQLVTYPARLFYAGQLFLAIQHLHKLGIIHRDIKPDNMLFDAKGNLVLSDFGLAKVFDNNAKGGPAWSKANHMGGDSFPLLWPHRDNPHVDDSPRGTDVYGAPEARAGQSYSYGIDYWSFSISFFEILTGLLPYAFNEDATDYSEPLKLDLQNSPSRSVFLNNTEHEFFYRVGSFLSHCFSQ
ncbi:kinase-like domain-containing protein [Mycena capillaripes]|nr:kinase-like domain-containing protein [Mycena capillaripes]